MNKPARIALLFIATFFTVVYLSTTYASSRNVVISAADPYLIAENGVQSTSETHIIKNQQLSVSVEEITPKKAAPEPSGDNVVLLGSSLFVLAALLLIVGYILIRRRRVLGQWLGKELSNENRHDY